MKIKLLQKKQSFLYNQMKLHPKKKELKKLYMEVVVELAMEMQKEPF